MRSGVVRPDARRFIMERKTLNAIGEALRNLIPFGDELRPEVQAALLKIAAREVKPVVVVALGDYGREIVTSCARAVGRSRPERVPVLNELSEEVAGE
jgi:hypothetical protein